MKKTLFSFALLALLAGYGCSDDEGGTDTNNAPVCSITEPKDNAILDLYADLVIKGTASDSDGTIAKVALTVDGKAVTEVTKVPFEYTIPAADLKEGNMKIKLTVEDDGGSTASDEITVVIQDMSQAPTCKITAPEQGAELNIYDPFTIKGEGAAVSGEISKVTLKINDKVIPEVTSLPFEHNVAAETYPVGTYTIALEVENSRGKIANDAVTVTLADKNVAPTCSIVEPAEGASFEADAEIVVKGTAADEDGTIASAVLKINDKVIEAVTTAPFEYTLTTDDKKAGSLRIVLEVTDNHGKTATDEVTIVILGSEREFTDTRDGKVYKAVKIGTQVWMAENLAYLPQVMNGKTESSTVDPCYYVYGYEGNDVAEAKATDNYKNEGVLYNWKAAGGIESSKNTDNPSGIQGPCPEGWHMPSEPEWNILYQYVRDQIPADEIATDDVGSVQYNVSGHLRAKGLWATKSDSYLPQLALGGMDTYGFAARPSGCVFPGSGFYYGPGSFSKTSVSFWTPHYDDETYNYSGGVTTGFSDYKYEPDFSRAVAFGRAYPIRCVQD